MIKTITCSHCGNVVEKSPRIMNQQYCHSKLCQQYRKNQWEKDKLKRDEGYREKRKFQKAQWRKGRPAHEYQKQYRIQHLVYQQKNRDSQNKRNKARKKIVKTDAPKFGIPIKPGVYVMSPYQVGNLEKIVKTDALIVEINNYQGVET